MAEHIPFITGDDGAKLVAKSYADSDIVRMPLDRAAKLAGRVPGLKLWVDPLVDGLHSDLSTRPETAWLAFILKIPHSDRIADAKFQAKPTASTVTHFVEYILDRAAALNPAWISVPQLPLVGSTERNKINRALASATAKWKATNGFKGKLILPLIFTHQDQVNGKTARNRKVEQAERCHVESNADGFWVVDQSLSDETGSKTLRNARFPGLIALHEELNERISSTTRVAGPYWGLNLVLWSRRLVDYPAVGVGSGYQYYLPGNRTNPPSARIALPLLRRRVSVGNLRPWLDDALAALSPAHAAHTELLQIKSQLTALSQPDVARAQVAAFYKSWFDVIASHPSAGRSMALFQDLSTAYALGKSLPDLPEDGPSRRPESIAEHLMLSCL